MTVPEIDADDAKELIAAGSVTVVDIRDPDSFVEGRIPGALRLSDANIEAFVAEHDRARSVVVCCYHGHSSLSATAFLIDKGFADVRSLRGGFEGWRHMHDFESGPEPDGG